MTPIPRESDSNGLAPVRHRTAQESVAHSLRQAIMNGQLEPGRHLVQSSLAKDLGVSITPVREALRQLASEGLVRLDPYFGATVYEASPDEVREVYEILQGLVPLMVRRIIANPDQSWLQKARQLDRQFAAETSLEGRLRLNRDLHKAICDAARSDRLSNTVGPLLDVVTVQIALTPAARSGAREAAVVADEHGAILTALELRDGDVAIALLREHMQLTIDGLLTPGQSL